ncbi:MAG: hypothetical protein HQ530_02680 [Parcubacteria group bacterium]|nr:hypothetical protein [Parcubacteria group bacterium]
MSEKLLLKGIPASQGIARGKAKIIKGSQDSNKFNRGDILVTKITDPTMVALIAQAGAIVCDIGGIVSHPSIVSRELGIPCVVNTKEATKKLKDGMMVRVDGGKGEIYSASQPYNILFVCAGNTCRSPAALHLANHYKKVEKVKNITFNSAGIEVDPRSQYFISNDGPDYLKNMVEIYLGEKVTAPIPRGFVLRAYKKQIQGGANPELISILTKKGIDSVKSHKPQQLSQELVERADLILTMSENHKNKITEKFNPEKVYTLIEYCLLDQPAELSQTDLSIADPLMKGKGQYQRMVEQVESHIKKLFNKLNKDELK